MNSFQQLEYNKIKNYLISECHSELGKQLTKDLIPLLDRQKIEYRLQLTREIQEICETKNSYNFEKISDVAELLLKFKQKT